MSNSRFSAVIRKLLAPNDKDSEEPIIDRPSDLELPWVPGDENAIQDMLDDKGFPWRSSCQELIDRFGLVNHPAYEWKQCPMKPCSLDLHGLIYPLSPNIVSKNYRDQIPLWFSGNIWIKNNALTNIRYAHRQISQLLGSAPIGKIANTISSRWRAGPARISLTVWQSKLQPSSQVNEAHKRDPRLQTACTVLIEPGYRQPMTTQEREWLKSFTPLATVRGEHPIETLEALWANAPDGGSYEFMRQPPTDQDNFLNQIGLSSDGMALIVCAKHLRIIPTERIVALKHQKLLPANGSGGAYLSLIYRAISGEERDFGLSGSFSDMDALDELAVQLRNSLTCPLRTPEPQYDC